MLAKLVAREKLCWPSDTTLDILHVERRVARSLSEHGV